MSVDSTNTRSLLVAIDIRLHEVLRHADFYVGLVGAALTLWLSITHPESLAGLAGTASAVVSVVVGAVLAGLAIISAFMDQAFLRKLKAIGKEPIRYMAPFIFTVWLGLWAILLVLVVAALPLTTPQWLLSSVATLAGGASFWGVASVVPDLKMLVDFVGLQVDAADIPDDFVEHS